MQIPDSPLFAHIPPENLPGLLECLQAQPRSYEKGQVIFWAGQTVEHVCLVLSGEAQMWQEDILGNRSIISRFGPGQLFGEAYALSGHSVIAGTVAAVQPTELLFIHKSRLLGVRCGGGECYHQLLENLLVLFAEHSLQLSRKLSCLSRRTLREKLLGYLYTQSRLAGSNRFSIPYSRQELADYLSVDRSALSKELSRMKAEGLLDYHRSDFLLFPESLANE